MLSNRRGEMKPSRLYILFGFLTAALLCYTAVLYNAQIVHGAEYRELSARSITQSEKVKASRGIITDRNGKALVTNRQIYSLTFDPSLLGKEDDANAAILRLLELCRQESLVWEDNLPLSGEAPYAYRLDSCGDVQKLRFIRFLQKKMKLLSTDVSTDDISEKLLTDSGLTPAVLLKDLRETFEIPVEWSDAQARMVLGVLYEVSVREVVNTTDYVMVEDISSELVSLLNDGDYLGVRVISTSTRQYETDCAAHVLGVVSHPYKEDLEKLERKDYDSTDWIGRSGAEAAFETYLKGTDGRRVISTNSEGKTTGVYYSTEPIPGSTVELTIDADFQKAVEAALAATVDKMTAKDGIARGAGAAVIGVGTGEVLALASYPSFELSSYYTDYNALLNDPALPLTNRATQGLYAPGSTLKPLTAIAALESGVTTTSETLRDTGYWTYPSSNSAKKWGFNCWNHGGHGLVNATTAITNSCNYYFGEMGYRMGLTKLNEWYSAFGLGSRTGIEIGDAAGQLATEQAGQDQAPWVAYGQSNQLYTPIQLANYIATLVSGGQHYDAHLLKSVKSADGSEILAVGEQEPSSTIPLSEENLNAVKRGMYGYTQPGGSVYPYFKNCVVSAGAKTGTAQVTAGSKNNGVFVCFAPYDDPQIALAMVIEKGDAGANLASAAVEILNAWFTADEIGTVILGENELLP